MSATTTRTCDRCGGTEETCVCADMSAWRSFDSSALLPVPNRPLLRYHGGKWKMAERILSYFPQHRIYVEPYGGAGSVLLQKPRCYAEINNDLDGEIVNLFRMVRERGSE